MDIQSMTQQPHRVDSRFKEYLSAIDNEMVMDRHIKETLASLKNMPQSPALKTSDEPWRPLFLGYGGTGNTGADVRLIESIRHFNHLFSHFEPTVMVSSPVEMPEAFSCINTLAPDGYFPDQLAEQVPRHDGVIIYEGSLYTSTFSDDLAMRFLSGLAMACACQQPAIAFGVQVDKMSDRLKAFLPETLPSQVLCRSHGSQTYAAHYNLRHQSGGDSAWTFAPPGSGQAFEWLQQQGWDGEQPVVAICPVNPFCWPVKSDPVRFAALAFDESSQKTHHSGLYFFNDNDKEQEQYTNYLEKLSGALQSRLKQFNAFPLFIPMEPVDRPVCHDLAQHFGKADITSSPIAENLSLSLRISLLQSASLVVSSRYHGALLALAAGTPVVGISIDNRIPDLFKEFEIDENWLCPTDHQFSEKLNGIITRCWSRREHFASHVSPHIADQLKRIAEMGRKTATELSRYRPDILKQKPDDPWQAFLPPLSGHQQQLLSDYGEQC